MTGPDPKINKITAAIIVVMFASRIVIFDFEYPLSKAIRLFFSLLASSFILSVGLSWRDPAGRQRTETDLNDWISKRASSGRMAPRGFPRDNKFN